MTLRNKMPTLGLEEFVDGEHHLTMLDVALDLFHRVIKAVDCNDNNDTNQAGEEGVSVLNDGISNASVVEPVVGDFDDFPDSLLSFVSSHSVSSSTVSSLSMTSSMFPALDSCDLSDDQIYQGATDRGDGGFGSTGES